MKKKLILIMITIFISLMTINVEALTIKPESTITKVGRNKNFDLSILVDMGTTDPDIYGIEGKVTYDASKFTLNNVTLNSSLSENNWTEFSNPKTNADNIFSIVNLNFQNPITSDKTIYTLNFTANSNAALGNSTFSIGNLTVSDINANPVTVSGGQTIIKVSSSDATLSSLSVTGYTLNPTFNKNTTTYSVTVPSSTSSVIINATATDSNAGVTGIGTKTLNNGLNSYTIKVTAEDGTIKNYVVNVTKEVSNNDATLKSLSLKDNNNNPVAINPAFNKNTTTYNAVVPSSTSSVIINATATDSNAGVTGIGTKTLNNGLNSYTIKVTAEDGTIKNYVVNVTKEVSNNDATLKSLSVTGYSFNQRFNSSITKYSITVPSSITSVTLNAEATDSNAIVEGKGNKNLNYGSNTFNIVVTAADKTTKKTYTIIVNRKFSNISTLSTLSLSKGTLSPAFSSRITNYTAIVDYEVSNITINATSSYLATIEGNGSKTLKVGENNFTITVTSADKTTTTKYYIKIDRKTNKSTDNTLKSLSLVIGTTTKNIEVKPTQTTYNVDISDNNLTNLEVKAVLNNSKASFVTGYGPRKIDLKVGNNIVLLKVLSENNEEKVYTLNINFNSNKDTNNYLKSLTLSEGKIEFNKDTQEYYIIVPYETEKIIVNAIAESEKAKVTIDYPDSLVVGKNKIIVTIVSESGGKREYIINIEKSKQVIIEEQIPQPNEPIKNEKEPKKVNIFLIIIIFGGLALLISIISKAVEYFKKQKNKSV